jgi:hypothetical protein
MRRKRSRPHGGDRNDPELLAKARRALGEDHPYALLNLVAALLEAATPRPLDELVGRQIPVTSRDLISSFMDLSRPETSGLLAGFALLVDSHGVRRQIEQERARRTHSLPPWVDALGDAVVTRVTMGVDPFGDDENQMIEVRWPDGSVMTGIVLLSHSLGGTVRDGFTVPVPIDSVLDVSSDPHGPRFEAIDPADSRARIEDAMASADRTYPPFQSETWPLTRPLIDWMVRLLPAGGSSFEYPEWTPEALDAIEQRFLASEFGGAFVGHASERLVEPILWFAGGYGPCDPLRWSPMRVEMLLTDWLPRKVIDDSAVLDQVPAVLEAFVEFAAAELRQPDWMTDEIHAAIDDWAPDYLQAIRRPNRVTGARAIAETLVAAVNDRPPSEDWWREYVRRSVVEQTGGLVALDIAGDDPLPSHEPFDWSAISPDIEPVVRRVLDLVDRFCIEQLDPEYVTVCRRLLSRIAVGDPSVFRTRSSDAASAVAVAWMAGQANGLFVEKMKVADLKEWFGFSTPTSRVPAFRAALGLERGDHRHTTGTSLGDVGLLTGAKRRQLLRTRRQYPDMS